MLRADHARHGDNRGTRWSMLVLNAVTVNMEAYLARCGHQHVRLVESVPLG